MILTLRAVSLNDQPLTRPITARFDAAGGTIGRADHSTLALPDPERFISRKQAEIVYVNGGYLIRNVGAANPIGLGHRTLANGESAMLGDGDDVRIGGYLLRAECSTAAAPAITEATLDRLVRSAAPAAVPVPAAPVAPVAPLAAAAPIAPAPAPPRPAPPPPVFTPPPPAPMPAAAAPASDNPFADLFGGGDDLLGTPAPAAAPITGAAAADPFADLLGGPPAVAAPAAFAPPPAAGGLFDDLMPPAAGLSAGSAAVTPPPPPALRLPDDFDPFASIAAAPAPRGVPQDDPFAALAPVAPPASIDQQFGLAGGSGGGGDPLKDFEFGLGTLGGGAGAPAPGGDPLAMFDLAPPAPQPPVPPPMADHLSAVHAAFEPPRVAAPPSPAAAPRTAAPAAHTAGNGSAEALWQAFCQGAGVNLPMPADPTQAAARLHQVGLVLRAAVEGTRELMAVRASTKYEMRAAVTQIMAKSNNPLKFAPDTRTGVEQLVQPATRGFLEGPAAMDDAMRDLVGHSIGTVAGMRAAIEGMLDRFDPATLEKTLGAGSMLDSLVPLNRKARLWELYLQRYRGIKEEAQEDFHALFGKAFVAAYEQQVARLKQGGKGS
jgi:FHA domain-containing protein